MRSALNGLARQVAGAMRRERTISWALFDQFVVSGANFVTTVAVARELGVEEFGHFALGWAAVLFVQSLMTAMIVFPMMSILPKLDAPGQRAYLPAFVTMAMIVSVAMPVVAVPAILFLLASTISGSMLAWLAPMTLASAAMLIHEVLRRLAFARGQPRRATASDVVRYVALTAMLLAGAALFEIDVGWVFGLQGFAAILGVAICVGVAPPGSRRVADLLDVAKRHWISAKWLLGSAGLSWVTTNWLAFVVGTFVGVSAVAGVRASETLMGVFSVLVQSLQNVVPVAAAKRLNEQGAAGMLRYVDRTALVLLTAGITTSIAAAAIASPLFELAFGPEFLQFSGLLFWFGLIASLMAVELPVSAGLRAMESTGAIFGAYLASTAWILVAGTAATFAFGLAGAVAAYLSTWLLRVGLTYLVLRGAAGRS